MIRIKIVSGDTELLFEEDTNPTDYPRIVSSDRLGITTKSGRLLEVIQTMCKEVKELNDE